MIGDRDNRASRFRHGLDKLGEFADRDLFRSAAARQSNAGVGLVRSHPFSFPTSDRIRVGERNQYEIAATPLIPYAVDRTDRKVQKIHTFLRFILRYISRQVHSQKVLWQY